MTRESHPQLIKLKGVRMPLVKITRSRQVTIPKELFEALHLQQGDYLEITREGEHLILRPKAVVDRERDEAKTRLFKLLDQIWERNRDVDLDLVEREVARTLREVRQNPRATTSRKRRS
jgi:AbrB family looped-hinge helix DNA binding protein